MAVPMDSAPHHYTPRKGHLQLSQNYRTIRLISHLKEVIMKVVLNRLKAKPEEINADEQARFTAGSSFTKISLSVKGAFNISKICTMPS